MAPRPDIAALSASASHSATWHCNVGAKPSSTARYPCAAMAPWLSVATAPEAPRAEAACGFSSVYDIALPALHAARRLAPRDEEAIRVQASMALIADVTDTGLLHRGGADGLRFAQTSALHRQVYVVLRVEIQQGFRQPGENLPSEDELRHALRVPPPAGSDLPSEKPSSSFGANALIEPESSSNILKCLLPCQSSSFRRHRRHRSFRAEPAVAPPQRLRCIRRIHFSCRLSIMRRRSATRGLPIRPVE